MALEDLTGADKFISNLVPANPVGSDDTRDGDNHIRGIKNVLKNTFPNLNGAVALTDEELSSVKGKVSKAGDTMTGTLVAGGGIDQVPDLLLKSSGITRVWIRAGGNVGIGTDTPNAPLHIIGALDAYTRFGASGADGFVGVVNANGMAVGTFGNTPFVLATVSLERMRISEAGHVGFGTTTPNKVGLDKAITVNGAGSSGLDLAVGDAYVGGILSVPGEFRLQTAVATKITFVLAGETRVIVDPSGHVIINNAAAVPAAPAGGGALYVEGGALKYRGSAGTITVLAPA